MVSQLRERRRRARLTQQALADLAGASRSMVRLLEAGYDPPRSSVRERVERVLDELEASVGQSLGSGAAPRAQRRSGMPGGDGDRPPSDRLLTERSVDPEQPQSRRSFGSMATTSSGFAVRVRSRVAHDRLWSAGTAGEQLTFEPLPAQQDVSRAAVDANRGRSAHVHTRPEQVGYPTAAR